MTSPEDRAPDYPPRIIEIRVMSGREFEVVGEDQFAEWELEGIYSALPIRDQHHCEGCSCEEAEQEGGTNV